MAEIDGSLIAQIGELSANEVTVGVLVIDEQQDFTGSQTLIENQQQLLVACGRFSCRFWLVELNPRAGIAPTSRTLLRLRALVHAATSIVAKTRFNAFEGTNLHASLLARGVSSHLVVLGHEVNCCVKQTAIGGRYKPGQPVVPGATGRGYTVMTAEAVLSSNGRQADWKQERDVEFYTTL